MKLTSAIVAALMCADQANAITSTDQSDWLRKFMPSQQGQDNQNEYYVPKYRRYPSKTIYESGGVRRHGERESSSWQRGTDS